MGQGAGPMGRRLQGGDPMMLARLSRMGLGEIAGRGRHEVTKWLERSGIVGGSRWDGTARVMATRFLDGVSSPTTPSLLADRSPESCARTISRAEQIIRGRFDLMGHTDLYFGDPIDWHLDPTSGRRAPQMHWSRLVGLDPLGGGDCKLVWELNRHQWMVRLGQAYRLTGDQRYTEASAMLLRQWMGENPPGIGINWMSSLEVGLRLISWCWALSLLSGSRALDPELTSLILGGIETHARHVERHLSYYFSPNTHLTGEALALLYAGLVVPDGRPARRWRALGWRILTEEIANQVLPDGVHFEQSTCYQRYTIEIYLHFIALAELSRRTVPQSVRSRLGLMLDFLVSLRRPDGTMPEIGDSDGGRLLPLDEGATDDFSALFSTSAALLGRDDCASAAGSVSSETIWMLGTSGVAAFDARNQAAAIERSSRLFSPGGYAVMTCGRPPRDHQLVFDVGPLGCHVSAGHGHADLLTIACSVFGRSCLVDPGTYCYAHAPLWRKYFRGSSAHSTVSVDGESSSRPSGPFSWKERKGATLRRWHSCEEFDFADAEHDAYTRLPDPVIHRRRLFFVKPRFWVVVDDLSGTLEHTVEMRYQFAAGYVLSLEKAPWVIARDPSGSGVFTIVHGTVPLGPELLEGSLDPIGGWVSPAFGKKIPAPALSYRATGKFPMRVATMFFPVERTTSRMPRVVPLMGEGPALEGFIINDGEELVFIDDLDVWVERK